MSRARRVEFVIVTEAISTHIQHACGSVIGQVPRLGIEPAPVGVAAVHAAMTINGLTE